MKTTKENLQELISNYNSEIENLEIMKTKYSKVLEKFNRLLPELKKELLKVNIILDENECSIVKTGNFFKWKDGDYFHINLKCSGNEKFKFLKISDNHQPLKNKALKISEKLDKLGFKFSVNHLSLENSFVSSKAILIEFWIK